MAWVKLDDQFPSHPKMVLAGGDAAWLHVCALCYCGQHLTDGMFPKAIVGRLSDRRNPDRLAARLVEVGAWLDHGDEYEIHGFLEFNRSREEVTAEREKRSAAGRRGAVKRWQSDSSGDGTSHSTTHRNRTDNSDAPDPTPLEEPDGSSTTKAERDALFDALVDAFGPATMRSRASHYGKCVKELLEHDATADEVRRRGKACVERFDNPSPEALLKWWDQLDAPVVQAAEPGPLLRERDGVLERFMPGAGWIAVA